MKHPLSFYHALLGVRLLQIVSACSFIFLSTHAHTEEMHSSAPSSSRWAIDRVLARVNGANILQSDLSLPRVAKEGGNYSLDEAILEKLLFQKAAEQHMLPSMQDIERQIVAFKIQNNMADLSEKEFEAQLKENGLTLKLYKEQLGCLIAVENIKRNETQDKIVVTAQEVEAHHKKHPRYVKAAYKLKIADAAEQQNVEKKSPLTWEDLGWVEKEALDKDLLFVTSMKEGETSEPQTIKGKRQCVMLTSKRERRPKTLDERYIEIEKELAFKKRQKAVTSFEKALRKKASIVRFDD